MLFVLFVFVCLFVVVVFRFYVLVFVTFEANFIW